MRKRSNSEDLDAEQVRTAVRGLVEAPRFATWLDEVPDDVLVQLAAPLEMLTFHFYLDSPSDRHLVRAARVACESIDQWLDDCPEDMAQAFRALDLSVRVYQGGR